MSKETLTTGLQVPAEITGKFNIAMTNGKFQQLADEGNKLEFTEENIPVIKDFLDRCRKVEKNIEETHKAGKAEALQIGRQWDSAKNTFMETVENIKLVPSKKYTELCQAIDERKRKQEQERQRIQNIKNGIESNAVMFAQKIANCDTTEALISVERIINLEKARKDKYQEFLEDAVTRFSELNSILAQQKEKVKALEEEREKELAALKAGDDAAVIEAKEKQEAIAEQIEENKVVVQETAINQATSAAPVVIPEEVLPEVKARRTTWKFEVLNIKEVAKKAPDLVKMEINDEAVKGVLKTLKDTNQLAGKTEYVLNGIRFYEDKTF